MGPLEAMALVKVTGLVTLTWTMREMYPWRMGASTKPWEKMTGEVIGWVGTLEMVIRQ